MYRCPECEAELEVFDVHQTDDDGVHPIYPFIYCPICDYACGRCNKPHKIDYRPVNGEAVVAVGCFEEGGTHGDDDEGDFVYEALQELRASAPESRKRAELEQIWAEHRARWNEIAYRGPEERP